MWTFLLDLLWDNQIVRWAIGGLALAGAFIFHGKTQKRRGVKEAETKMEIRDHEKADEIRDNVEHNLDDELRKHEHRGYRDSE